MGQSSSTLNAQQHHHTSSDECPLPLLLSNESVLEKTDTTAIVPVVSSDTAVWANSLQVIPNVFVFTGDLLTQTFTHIKHLFITPEYDKNKVSDAIEKLQSTLSFLDNKIATMNTNVEKYTIGAKRLYNNKNKQAAIHQLRLKKMYEREVAKMDSLKFNIESNILHMESVGVMMETVSTIKETSHQFQIVSRHVDIGKLEDSIEEMFVQRDTSKDIENILNDMHNAHEFDEDELMQELETLVSDGDTPPSQQPSPCLPNANTQQTATNTIPTTIDPTTATLIANMPNAPHNAILIPYATDSDAETIEKHTAATPKNHKKAVKEAAL